MCNTSRLLLSTYAENNAVHGVLIEKLMARPRAVIQIPLQLAAEIDQLAGRGHRSEFAIEVLDQEVKRRQLLKILENKEPLWKNEDHPELAQGAEAWVRQMRQEDEVRFQRIQQNRDRD